MILDGRVLQRELLKSLRSEIQALALEGPRPLLKILLFETKNSSQTYAHSLLKLAVEVGIEVEIKKLAETISPQQFRELIQQLNADPHIHGILPMMPLPPQLDRTEVGSLIAAEKDVDGLNPANIGRVCIGAPLFAPSTATAVMRLLDYYRLPLVGKRAVILGRSLTVGRPLALLLLARDATLTICHSRSADIQEISCQADLLVSAMGNPGMVNASFVKPGAVVIDVGTTIIEGKLRGDVLFEDVQKVAGAISPVPGGVGPVTTVVLLEAVFSAYKNFLRKFAGKSSERENAN